MVCILIRKQNQVNPKTLRKMVTFLSLLKQFNQTTELTISSLYQKDQEYCINNIYYIYTASADNTTNCSLVVQGQDKFIFIGTLYTYSDYKNKLCFLTLKLYKTEISSSMYIIIQVLLIS